MYLNRRQTHAYRNLAAGMGRSFRRFRLVFRPCHHGRRLVFGNLYAAIRAADAAEAAYRSALAQAFGVEASHIRFTDGDDEHHPAGCRLLRRAYLRALLRYDDAYRAMRAGAAPVLEAAQ